MNILLHICCAPCAIYPVEAIRSDGNTAAGFFYNPNVHPYSEYLRRKGEVEKYAAKTGLTVTYADYDMAEYFQRVDYTGSEADRCPACWWMRLAKAVEFAAECGFDAFTTTLLGSPYQDHNPIKTICEDIAKGKKSAFYYHDFRTGFRQAHQKARAMGIYCQNYCGCVFSEKERLERKLEGKGQRA